MKIVWEIPSIYAVVFDKDSKLWIDKDEREDYDKINMFMLRSMEKFANDMLKVYGKLYLSKVYELLDIPITPINKHVGWKYDSEHGDGYVDFGISRYRQEDLEEAIRDDGYVLLDFNVDGLID